MLSQLLQAPVGRPGGQWNGATGHQTEFWSGNFVRCICILHQQSQEKLPLYIQGVKKSRVGISFALPHAEVERCLWYDRRINPVLVSFKKRNAKCHSSGFHDSATNSTLSGQLITAASVNFCSNTRKQSAHTSSKHWARAGVSSNIRKAGVKEVALRSSSARSSSPQTDTRWVIPCSSRMENSLSQSGLKITQNSSRKCLCGI